MTVGTSPGPIECFGHAWQQLKRAFVPMLAVTTGWAIAGALAGRVPSGWPRLLVQALFAGPIGIGAMGASLRVARGQTPEPGDLLAAFRRDWAQAALLCLLLGCAVAVGAGVRVHLAELRGAAGRGASTEPATTSEAPGEDPLEQSRD